MGNLKASLFGTNDDVLHLKGRFIVNVL